MNDTNTKDYMIDVAQDTTYQNQSDDYKKSFAKWRSNPQNSFGFQFIHDTREHSYIDGEGFVPHKAEVAERISMLKCCSLLGICLVVMLAIDFLNYFIVNKYAPDTTGTFVYFSQTDGGYGRYDVGMTFILGLLFAAKFVVPGLIFKIVTKIPNKVVFANSKGYEKMRLDGIYSIFVFSEDPVVALVSFAFFAIIVPIMQEIVFRGIFLQTFRQFGDTFAIMITAVVNGLCYYDITYLPFVVCCTAVLGLFTIRTGSVFTAISMSICAHITNFVLSYIVLYDLPYAKIAEVIICTVIVGVSLVMYSKLTSFGDWTFNIENDNSFMTMSKRVKSFIATNSIAVWIAAILVTMFVCARII